MIEFCSVMKDIFQQSYWSIESKDSSKRLFTLFTFQTSTDVWKWSLKTEYRRRSKKKIKVFSNRKRVTKSVENTLVSKNFTRLTHIIRNVETQGEREIVLWLEWLRGQANKSIRRMPWHQEPKKDVTSCDKPRGGANIHRAVDFRMGKPSRAILCYCMMNQIVIWR